VGCGKGAGVSAAVEQEGVNKALDRRAEGRLSFVVIAILERLRGLAEETLGLRLEISWWKRRLVKGRATREANAYLFIY
jgi:hypothetical protein